MPRGPRIDIPGFIHHVVCRGIEKSAIFKDNRDCEQFLARISKHANSESIHVYAFSLMPNHFHLLVRPLAISLATFMRRVLTGYALYFNRRHTRSGHLFQNRYKSFVVEEEAYLLELVRYIHLNPIRAGIISNLKALSTWPYSGYSALMGNANRAWFEVDYTLSLFDTNRVAARKKLVSFVEDGRGMGRRDELVGGGLKRSLGMSPSSDVYIDSLQRQAYDERILGSGSFVEAVLSTLDKDTPNKEDPHPDIDELIKTALSFYGIALSELHSGSKRSAVSKARSAIVLLGAKQCGIPPSELAEALRISQSAVYSIISRGGGEGGDRRILDLIRKENL